MSIAGFEIRTRQGRREGEPKLSNKRTVELGIRTQRSFVGGRKFGLPTISKFFDKTHSPKERSAEPACNSQIVEPISIKKAPTPSSVGRLTKTISCKRQTQRQNSRGFFSRPQANFFEGFFCPQNHHFFPSDFQASFVRC